MQVLQHVVDEVTLLHVAKARIDGLGLDAIRHEPAQRAGGIGLDLRGGRQARHERRVLTLAIATAQDQIWHGLGTQMLRGFTGHALALEAFACRGIEVPYDIALTHALRLSVVSCLSVVSGLGVRTQLGPHGRRIALTRLTIVGHTGERNRTTRCLHRTAKAHAQQGRGLKRHALATEARRQRGQRALLVRERIAVQIDIGKQHGIVAAGAQSRRIGKRSKTNLSTWRTVNLVGLVIVGGATLVHLGANAIEHGHGRSLRHVERAGAIHKDVDDVAQQGHLRLATGLAIQAAQRAIGNASATVSMALSAVTACHATAPGTRPKPHTARS